MTTLDTSTSHYLLTDEAKGTDRGAEDEEEEESGTNYTASGGRKRETAHEKDISRNRDNNS